jgi:hypothetical protein
VRHETDAIFKVSCLMTQSSAKISDTVTFVVVERMGTDSRRQSGY